MRMDDEIDKDDLVVARLAMAYTLLAMAPYDSWNHEGDPCEMAAYVVAQSKKEGRFGFLRSVVLGRKG